MTERYASYVASADCSYFVTTIFWQNDLTGRFWNESGISDLERMDANGHPVFTLIQHDIWPLETGHKEIVRLLQQGLIPQEIWSRDPWIIRGVLRA